MTDDYTDSLTRQCADAAVELVEARIPVVVLQHGRKVPVRGQGGTRVVLIEPEDVFAAIERASQHGPPNLGGALVPGFGSRLAVVDQDGKEATPKLHELGVSSRDKVWIFRTGRGNYNVVYYWSTGSPPPPRVIRAGGLPLDLLSDGYVVLPPSNTYLEPKGGGPYRWVSGHSPFDIPLPELASPPGPLLAWWAERAPKVRMPIQSGLDKPKAYRLLDTPIPEGRRNDTLTSIAGWLRAYHPFDVVSALLLAINDARCQPPLEAQEVEAIVRSVTQYPQQGVNGHPRAALPRYVREERAHV